MIAILQPNLAKRARRRRASGVCAKEGPIRSVRRIKHAERHARKTPGLETEIPPGGLHAPYPIKRMTRKIVSRVRANEWDCNVSQSRQ